jgi:hypothetical protein
MHDAGYFRERAELYFELSRRMSVPTDAQYFHGAAERYLARAVELEARPGQPRATQPRPAWEAHRDASPFGRT